MPAGASGIDHPEGFFVAQEHSAAGELTAIRENGTTLLAAYEYDQLGRRDRLTLGNGAVTDYQYDGASRLSKLVHDLAGTGHDNEVSFDYNPARQIVRREASNSAYSWTNHFNASAGQSFDGLNRPIGDAHDARSNRATDGIRTYAYDSENKGRGVPAAPWHYDPLGRLSGASTSPGTPPAIIYESYVDNLVAERSPGSPTVQRRHVFGPGVDEPIVWYEGSSRRFLHADERGSIVAVTSDAGALLAINRFDEYGQTESTSNAYTGRFLYTGQRWFGGFGIYHYKNRMYDPKVGRFMQPDPIGYAAGMNLYAYVGGDPVNFTDPFGLEPKEGEQEDEDGTEIVVTGRRPGGGGGGGGGAGAAALLGAGRSHRGHESIASQVTDAVEAAQEIADIVVTAVDKARKAARPSLWTRFKQGIGWVGRKVFCGCLEAGTMVSTPHGLRRIEDIKVGDLVLAVNEATGEIAAMPVTDLIRPEAKPLYALRLLDASGEPEAFHATDDHPWKVEGKGWVETVDLKPGDRIDTGSGADMVVTSLTLTSRVEKTYNLTVAEWHTFMVGEDGAVVHNSTCGKSAEKLARQMEQRGWTPESIEEARLLGASVKAINKRNGNPATRYIHPSTGASVIIDDTTGAIIHVGAPGFNYGPESGDVE